MSRVNNWPSRLNALVDVRRNTPFQWGNHDCLLWPADVVAAITDSDPALEFRGTYDSPLSAMRIVKQHGGMAALVDHCTSFERVPVAKASRGDVVMTTYDGRLCGGVCLGNVSAFVGATGLVFLPRTAIEIAWRTT